jgi:20S proteasome subunit alpha 6
VKIYELNPSGECYEFKSFAIGAKSQSAKTYIEKNVDQFENLEMDDLIVHGLKAIKSGYKDEKEEMSGKNIEVYALDLQEELRMIGPDVVQSYIDQLNPNKIIEEEN